MSHVTLALNPGVSVVLEGLDGTGKSTQLSMLKNALDPDTVVFAHMPSGFTQFTRQVYEALESEGEKPSSWLAQQLAHLACHAESIEQLVAATNSRALVLDRWWWSTLAYGWYGGSVRESGLSERSFRDLIDTIWAPVVVSVVFVFLDPYRPDSNNVVGVEAGYRTLLDQYPDLAVVVSDGFRKDTHDFIVRTLVQRGLAHRV
jgi:energy-coupling factor transporter ATP-binding protein EcfA2